MKIDAFNKRKGAADLIPIIIVVLIVLGLLLFFFISNELERMGIHVMIQEAGAERRTLNLGQALLSYDKLVYVEDVENGDYATIHRGVFDAEKVESQFTRGSDLTSEFGYPDTFIVLYVKDVETGEKWKLAYNGPFNKVLGFEDVMSCIISKTRIDITMFFSISKSPWKIPDVASCLSSEFSSYGTAIRYFPVAIRYEDAGGVHVNQGVLKVSVYEWWLASGVK